MKISNLLLVLNCALVCRAAPARVPLVFEPNQGQAPSEVQFVSRGKEYQLLLYKDGPAMNVRTERTDRSAHIRLRFAGANTTTRLEAVDPQPGKSNYLLGRNPRNWQLDVPHFSRVRYRDLYAGINVVCYGNDRRLEYDFVVAPGADPRAIQLAFEGVRAVRIGSAGDLLLQTAAGDIVQHKPVVYQERKGRREIISARYRIRKDGRVGFEVANYDRSRRLTIDPVMSYATFLGGNGGDDPAGIAVDSAGNTYIAGTTKSFDFPTTQNAFQPQIASRSLFRTTTSGGWANSTAGLTTTSVETLIADPANSGAVYAGSDEGVFKSLDAGANWSPLSNGLPDKGLTLLAMDPRNPSTLYAGTYSGVYTTANGGNNWQRAGSMGSWITSLAVDPANPETVFAGTLDQGVFKSTDRGATWQAVNTGLPSQPIDTLAIDPNSPGTVFAGMAAGLFKTTDGGQTWSATQDSKLVFVRALAIGADSTVYAGLASGNGVCKSADGGGTWNCVALPGNAAVNALVFGSHGSSILYAATNRGVFSSTDGDATWTAVGGNLDRVNVSTFAVDAVSPALMYAGTSGGADAFVTKLNSTGTGILYSTYFGGSADESGNAIALDPAGNIYVAGTTSSADFPVTSGAFQTNLAGGANGFIAKLDSSGKLVYSTYLGGASVDSIQAIAVDGNGMAHVTGTSTSPDFPGRSDASAPQSAFIATLNAAGAGLVFSTLLGGSGGTTSATGIALDNAGGAYIIGATSAANYPVTGGAFQTTFKGAVNAFVTHLDSSGALLYSTYLGGSGSDLANGVAVDATGNAYVAGETTSRDFPVVPGSFQTRRSSSGSEAFVAKLSSDGSDLVYGTFLGGGAADMRASAIAVDSSGSAFITGSQPGPSFRMTADAVTDQGSGFLSVLDPSGSTVRYATLVGCGCEAIVLDGSGAAYLTGYADYSMPATPGAAQTQPSEYDKGIVIKIDLKATASTGSAAMNSAAASAGSGGGRRRSRASAIRKRSLRPVVTHR